MRNSDVPIAKYSCDMFLGFSIIGELDVIFKYPKSLSWPSFQTS